MSTSDTPNDIVLIFYRYLFPLSIIGAGFIVVSYLRAPSIYRHLSQTLVFFVAISDFAFAAAGAVTPYMPSSILSNPSFCITEGAISNFSAIGTICWHIVINWYILTNLRDPLTSIRFKKLVIWQFVIWGYALLSTIVIVSTSCVALSSSVSACWISNASGCDRLTLFFYIPVILSLILSVITWFSVLSFMRLGTAETNKDRHSLMRWILLYLGVFVLTWSWVVALRFAVTIQPNSYPLFMLYMDRFVVSIQGFVNAFIWICHPNFRFYPLKRVANSLRNHFDDPCLAQLKEPLSPQSLSDSDISGSSKTARKYLRRLSSVSGMDTNEFHAHSKPSFGKSLSSNDLHKLGESLHSSYMDESPIPSFRTLSSSTPYSPQSITRDIFSSDAVRRDVVSCVLDGVTKFYHTPSDRRKSQEDINRRVSIDLEAGNPLKTHESLLQLYNAYRSVDPSSEVEMHQYVLTTYSEVPPSPISSPIALPHRRFRHFISL